MAWRALLILLFLSSFSVSDISSTLPYNRAWGESPIPEDSIFT